MGLDPVSSGIDLVTTIISRVWPDRNAQEKAQLDAALRQDDNFVKLMTAQMAVNAAEATSSSLFVSGARPCVMWICAAGFAWQFVVLPILLFIGTVSGHPIVPPVFDTEIMTTALFGLLGLGSMRSYERVKGVIPPGR